MKEIYQYILLAVAMVATASCCNEQPVENGTLQFVVGDFPAFGEDPQTRASSGTLSYLKTERPTVMAVYTSSDTPGLGEYLITTDDEVTALTNTIKEYVTSGCSY